MREIELVKIVAEETKRDVLVPKLKGAQRKNCMQRGACLSTSIYPPTTAVTWLSEARDTNSRKSTIGSTTRTTTTIEIYKIGWNRYKTQKHSPKILFLFMKY